MAIALNEAIHRQHVCRLEEDECLKYDCLGTIESFVFAST